MKNIIYLLLRRLRVPLIVIILSYSISILGLVLMPGIDDQGQPWHMSLFHAFYFVSFMASTIGFGEIPYPFTEEQRLWTTLAMYLTVISWLYAIGTLLALLQEPAFRRVVAFANFTRSIRRIREPFYLLCGLGEAGQLVTRELAERDIISVVIDQEEKPIQELQLENLRVPTPALCADVTDSSTLLSAGLTNGHCAGVIALTGTDHINLTVAISSKLLASELPVICRSETHDSEANMASFGTDYIINPFDTFARRFAMMFQSPSMYLVYEWMTSLHEAPLTEFSAPPRGIWIVCGFGRFGKAVRQALSFEGIQTVIVELDTAGTGAPQGTIEGRGTEAITLHEAGIEQAVGIIAGTDDDANNLSIIITALDMNPQLYTVARQNLRSNDAIFSAARIDLVMQASVIIGRRVVDLITNPMLTEFLRLASNQNESWANLLVSRVAGILTDSPPQTWVFSITQGNTPALLEAFIKEMPVTLGHLTVDPRDTSQALPCVPLFLKRRNHEEILLPENDIPLQYGDKLMFIGLPHAEMHMRWTAHNFHALNYICTGYDRPSGTVWRLLSGERSP